MSSSFFSTSPGVRSSSSAIARCFAAGSCARERRGGGRGGEGTRRLTGAQQCGGRLRACNCEKERKAEVVGVVGMGRRASRLEGADCPAP
eukprot:332953-Chlamydomonas_euryale.AAC.1